MLGRVAAWREPACHLLLQLWKPGTGSARKGRGRVYSQSLPLHSLLYCLGHAGLAGMESSDLSQ